MILHSLTVTSLITKIEIFAYFNEQNKNDQKDHEKDKIKKQRYLLSYFPQSRNILKY